MTSEPSHPFARHSFASQDPFRRAGFAGYPACRLSAWQGPSPGEAAPCFLPHEAARLARLQSPLGRAELEGSLQARRWLVSEITGAQVDGVVIEPLSEGAPNLVTPVGWSLTIATKGAFTTVAMQTAPAEIGVDIEMVRPIAWRGMLEMLCSAGERDDFERAFESKRGVEAAFFRMWTLKEAALKATRRGFRAGPKAVETPAAILAAPGDGQLTAFGDVFDFWTADVDDLVVSLVRRRTQPGSEKAIESGLAS
jgi:phosphopantetheinyl transferase